MKFKFVYQLKAILAIILDAPSMHGALGHFAPSPSAPQPCTQPQSSPTLTKLVNVPLSLSNLLEP